MENAPAILAGGLSGETE